MVHRIVITCLILLNIFVYFFAKNYIQPVKADVELCGEAGRVNRAHLDIYSYDCEDELPDIKEAVSNTVTYIDGLPVLFDKDKNPIQFEEDGYPLGSVDYNNASDPQAFTEEGTPVVIVSANELYVVEGGGIVEGGVPAVLSDTAVIGSNSCTTPIIPTILNPNKLAEAINGYIRSRNPNSPLNGYGSDFVQAGRNFQVNPMLIVAHAQWETGFGKEGSGIEKGSNNAFGRTATSDQPGIEAGKYKWYKFESFQESIYGQASFMKRVYINQGKTDIVSYVNKYAPPNENDTVKYIKEITRIMNKIAQDAEMECE